MSHQERGVSPSNRDRLVKTAQRGLQLGVGVAAVFSANVVDVDNTQASSRVEPTANRLNLQTSPLQNADYLRIRRIQDTLRGGRGDVESRSGRGEQREQDGLLFNGGFEIRDPQNLSEPLGWDLVGPAAYVFRGGRGDSSVIGRVVDCPTGAGGIVRSERLMPIDPTKTYEVQYDATRSGGQLNNRPRAILEFYDAAGILRHTLRADGVPQKALGVRETFRLLFGAGGNFVPADARWARLSLQAMDIACSSGSAEVEFWRASVKIDSPR